MQIDQREDIMIIQLQDPLKIPALNELDLVLTELIEDGVRKLIIDMEKVQIFHSMGIRVLISARRHLARVGGSLKLTRLHAQTRRVLEAVELLDMFEIYDTIDAACDSFQQTNSA